MLSVSSRDYFTPVFIRHMNGESDGWRLARHTDDLDLLEETKVYHFNYTIPVVRKGVLDRMTFEYTESGGVRPSSRTLRVYGNKDLKLVISKLAGVRKWEDQPFDYEWIDDVIGEVIDSLGMDL